MEFEIPPAGFIPIVRPVVWRKSRIASSIARVTGRVAFVATFPVEVLMKSAPAYIAIIEALRATKHLTLKGLMTMPPWNDDPEVTRPYFRRLAALAREHDLAKLSMGMSHDLEAAIEEGSTHVRVGTALFGKRPKPPA